MRHHNHVARIELPADELGTLLTDADRRRRIAAELTDLGYERVTLDALGFRSGSMNEVLGARQDTPVPDVPKVLRELGYEGDGQVDEQVLCLQLSEPSVGRLVAEERRSALCEALRHPEMPYVALELTGAAPAR